MRLGVNIDHVATLRQARGTSYPSPLTAAFVAQSAGADGITAHLREDRRHIQDADVAALREHLPIPLNFECAITPEMLDIAERLQPAACCFVPERREELTTEGGLDVVAGGPRIAEACARMRAVGARPSLFIEADLRQLDAAVAAGAQAVEIHTGHYARLDDPADLAAEVRRIGEFAAAATDRGLEVHAGHGLTVANVAPIARIPEIVELNIGHALVCDAVIMGLAAAVARMKGTMIGARSAPRMHAA